MKTNNKHVLLLIAALAIVGCTNNSSNTSNNNDDSSSAKQTNSSNNQKDFEQIYNNIPMDSFKKHVKTLSSDLFAGRAPASPEDKMTREYLIDAFKSAGLQPGNNGAYTQAVELMGVTGEVVKPLSIGDIGFEFKQNYVANSRQNIADMALNNSALVFVGYGINAPEYGWNDYAGLDVKGKTVVVLVNDPGYATQDLALFEGKTMTYYGRWTYKYEEAARQGAAGAIIIHETGPAGYGWDVIANSWTGTQFQLPHGKNANPILDVELWINLAKTRQLFATAGYDFAQYKLKAQQKGFKAIELGLKVSVAVKSKIEKTLSYNVVATLPGSTHPDEHILYMGHIDHLGKNLDLEGDQIFNGAHDNATGTAGLIEIAKAFAALKQRPARSITFIGAAAEEQGTLGSRFYADHPSIALNKTVGLINMDSLNITGRKKDVTVVGFGKSALEKVLEKAAKRQNRVLAREAHPERGYYYRSDHFSLAIKGVPALSSGGGTVPVNDVEAQINKRVGAMVSKCYHQVCDEYDESWGWAGAKENLQLYFETGYLLANSEDWPNWYEGTEFRALRDAMMP
ncbi:MAG: M28 family peptidase [Algicola sp.]|nr:M28 family peptidase [Algicola sp.]